MAKTKRTRDSVSFDGMEQLTYEECLRELFGELFDLPPRPAGGTARVTQMGPGRRSKPRPQPKTKEK